MPPRNNRPRPQKPRQKKDEVKAKDSGASKAAQTTKTEVPSKSPESVGAPEEDDLMIPGLDLSGYEESESDSSDDSGFEFDGDGEDGPDSDSDSVEGMDLQPQSEPTDEQPEQKTKRRKASDVWTPDTSVPQSPAGLASPVTKPTDSKPYRAPELVLLDQLYPFSSDSEADSDPDAELGRDERTWAGLAPWEEEYYGPLRSKRAELKTLLENTNESLDVVLEKLVNTQKDMDKAWKSHGKKTGVKGPPVIDLETYDPRLDPTSPEFDVSAIPPTDPNFIPPRHEKNQRAIRESLLEIRDALLPLLKSWRPVDPRLKFYATERWEQGLPEREAEDKETGRGKGGMELFEYPPWTLKPEWADAVWSAFDPLWKARYESKATGNLAVDKRVENKPKREPKSRTLREPSTDAEPMVLKFGDITLRSSYHARHASTLPAPATPAHLLPYTAENTSTLPFLDELLHTVFEPFITLRYDPTPFFFSTPEETAGQERIWFPVFDRAAYLEEGLEHDSTEEIVGMVTSVKRGIAMYLAGLEDRDRWDALEVRRSRRRKRGEKRAGDGEKKGDERAWEKGLLEPLDYSIAEKERLDSVAAGFLAVFRPEMEDIRTLELDKVEKARSKPGDAEAERKARAAQGRMRNLKNAVSLFGFRDGTDKLIQEEIEAGKKFF
jgi:hypothetical protein